MNQLHISPHQSATSSITASPESVESQPSQSLNNNVNAIHHSPLDDLSEYEALQREMEELEEDKKRTFIIEKLYHIIESEQPLLSAKITGMIIHKQSTNKLLKLLLKSNRDRLHDKINEATKLLTDTISGGLYCVLFHEISRINDSKERLSYLRTKLYPQVKDYVMQPDLANIITEMLLQLNIAEIIVLLNENMTMKQRMDEAIKAYLEWNADIVNKLDQINGKQ